MAFVQKADSVFKKKLKELLAPSGFVHYPGGVENAMAMDDAADVAAGAEPIDFSFMISRHTVIEEDLASLFLGYGTYLLFIGEDAPVGEARTFEFKPRKLNEEAAA